MSTPWHHFSWSCTHRHFSTDYNYRNVSVIFLSTTIPLYLVMAKFKSTYMDDRVDIIGSGHACVIYVKNPAPSLLVIIFMIRCFISLLPLTTSPVYSHSSSTIFVLLFVVRMHFFLCPISFSRCLVIFFFALLLYLFMYHFFYSLTSFTGRDGSDSESTLTTIRDPVYAHHSLISYVGSQISLTFLFIC